jgi:allantoicase
VLLKHPIQGLMAFLLVVQQTRAASEQNKVNAKDVVRKESKYKGRGKKCMKSSGWERRRRIRGKADKRVKEEGKRIEENTSVPRCLS